MNHITIADQQGVRVITLNRPEKRNALDLNMYRQLTTVLREGDTDDSIGCYLLRGQADCFTSGNDIADFQANSDLGPGHPAYEFLFCLLDINKPLVAAVTGAAVGIGTTVLLHCDLVYADSTAKFQLPFVNLALVPEAGASLLLPQLVGRQKAAELLLLGEGFDAATAQTLGLVNTVLASEEVFSYAQSQAQKLAQQPPQAVQATRRLMRFDQEAVRQQMRDELEEFGQRLSSDEAKARFAAFMNK